MEMILALENLLDITAQNKEELVDEAGKKALMKRDLAPVVTMQASIITVEQYLVSDYLAAYDAWKKLHNAFDRQNTIPSFYQMRLMHDLRHSEDISIPEYIQIFGIMWSQTHNRFANSIDAHAKILKPICENDSFKTSLFRGSLHTSLNDIVDNLQTLRKVVNLV